MPNSEASAISCCVKTGIQRPQAELATTATVRSAFSARSTQPFDSPGPGGLAKEIELERPPGGTSRERGVYGDPSGMETLSRVDT